MIDVDVVVVGGGIAGVQAALVLGRARRSVTVVDGGEPRNARAERVHNLAGHEGVPPGELLDRARKDAEGYGVRIVPGTVAGAEYVDAHWLVGVPDGEVLRTRALVLATGVVEDLPDVEGLAEHWGRDVVSCPYCHGWEAQGKPVAVVGAGARAWQQLLLMHRFTNDLALLSNGPTGMDERRLRHLDRVGISVREEPIARVTSDQGRLDGVEFADGTRLRRDVLFAATTRRQAAPLAAALGCTVTDEAAGTDQTGHTGVPGVWAVGTCAQPTLTIAGSAGQATSTAIALNTTLIEEETAWL